jgi:hypothetical protein
MSVYQDALAAALKTPVTLVDWPEWWRGTEPAKHRLYLGGQSSCWDVCCERRVLGRDAPQLLIGIRPYLRRITRAQGSQRFLPHPHLLSRHAPLYFDFTLQGEDLTYVDLTRAYHSIYTRATLDVAYDGINVPRLGRTRFLDSEDFKDERLFRNALLGSLRRKWRRGLDHGQPFRELVPAHDQRPNLWGLVMDCLELAAWEMRRLGAVYVHTDGYVFQHRDIAIAAQESLMEKFGLDSRLVINGPGIVTGLGRWRIADTVHGPRVTPEPGRRIDTMQPVPSLLAGSLTDLLKSGSMIADQPELATGDQARKSASTDMYGENGPTS